MSGSDRIWAWLLAGCALLVAGSAAATEGTVTRVWDGDTVWVQPLTGGAPLKVRVLGIDAPEICQPGGTAARDALAARVLNRPVRLDGAKADDHGRRLSRLWRGNEDVGATLVRDGLAWSYRFRRDPGPYAAQEAEARRQRLGVFAAANPVPPRDFRRRNGPCS